MALTMTTPAEVAVERNAAISGLGNKGWMPETFVDMAKPTRIVGSFTLMPLDDTWPAAAREIFHPFHHSYDQ